MGENLGHQSLTWPKAREPRPLKLKARAFCSVTRAPEHLGGPPGVYGRLGWAVTKSQLLISMSWALSANLGGAKASLTEDILAFIGRSMQWSDREDYLSAMPKLRGSCKWRKQILWCPSMIDPHRGPLSVRFTTHSRLRLILTQSRVSGETKR